MQATEVSFYDDGVYLRVEDQHGVRYINKKGMSMQHDRSAGFTIRCDDFNAYFSFYAVTHPVVTSLAELIETLRIWCSGKVPDLDASKITTGVLHPDRIPPLDASKIVSGLLEAARIPGSSASAPGDYVGVGGGGGSSSSGGLIYVPGIGPDGIDASKITSGVLAPERLPGIDASTITSGVLARDIIPADLDASVLLTGKLRPELIPELDASLLTSGRLAESLLPVLGRDKLPPLDASQLASGLLADERVPPLDADKISSGILASERIPPLDAGKVASGLLASDRIPPLDAAKVASGILSLSRIPALPPERVPPLDATKLTTGTLDAARLPPLQAMTGTLPVPQGGTGATSLLAGKLLCGAGASSVTAAQGLHWDAANARLGIRTATPSEALHVAGNLMVAQRISASNMTSTGQVAGSAMLLPRGAAPAAVANAAILYCDAADGLLKVVTDSTTSEPTTGVLGPFFRSQTSYFYAASPSSVMATTASTTPVAKLSALAQGLPAGIYRVALVFQGFTTAASKPIRVLAFVDAPGTGKDLHDSTAMFSPGYNTVISDFCNVALSAGDHTFVVQYASPSGAQIGLSRAAVEAFRVSG